MPGQFRKLLDESFGAAVTKGSVPFPLRDSINLSGVQFNQPKCGSGLNGGFFEPEPGTFEISAKFSGSYNSGGVDRNLDVTFDFLSCEISSSGVTCTL